MLPLRETVVFPYMVIPLFVGRPKSLKAIEVAMEGNRELLVVSQKEASTDDPEQGDIYRVGTVCRIMQMLKLPDGIIKILVEGLYRARILDYLGETELFEVSLEHLPEDPGPTDRTTALKAKVLALFEQYLSLNKKIPVEILHVAGSVTSPGRMADIISAHLNLKVEVKQAVLEAFHPDDRLEMLAELLSNEIKILGIEQEIRGKVREDMEDLQKDSYLRDQMRSIQRELGEAENTQAEAEEYKKKVEDSGMPEEAREKCDREIEKLSKMASSSAEASVLRNWLDIMVDLPWAKETEDHLDISHAAGILDADHYGLEEPKDRILEHLSVVKLRGGIKGPILCLLGPPGVGKTSLARSVARAMGREYGRMALGGMRDEAEIRGHRRTYVGAMPGRLIQLVRKLGVRNPVILLDEIDKTGADFKGDPASALLEVLDPEQNQNFTDHCLGVPFDLSQVLFFTTANVPHTIPPALRDRMEILSLPGYTEEEKLEIGKRHLVPKQREENGLEESDIEFTEEGLTKLIRYYTREAGVRDFERKIGAVCRKVARDKVSAKRKRRSAVKITAKKARELLGVPRYTPGLAHEKDLVGHVTGLAWTSVGGTVLPIEAVAMQGTGKTILTGQLGKVMQESAQAAVSWVRRHREAYNLPEDFHKTTDIHIHAPEGAIPKDGPSAGITIATAVVSALTGVPVRHDIAMTGEVTLKGDVLPVGGIKEKLLAAYRLGVKIIVLCKENERNLEDLPAEVREDLEIHLVEHLDAVLALALRGEVPMETPVHRFSAADETKVKSTEKKKKAAGKGKKKKASGKKKTPAKKKKGTEKASRKRPAKKKKKKESGSKAAAKKKKAASKKKGSRKKKPARKKRKGSK